MQKNKTLENIIAYAKIILGSAIYAMGFQFFTYPNAIPTGGLSGIAMIINFLCGAPVGVLIIIMNIPLFAFAWKKFGVKFILASMCGMILSSAFVDLLAMAPVVATNQPLLAALYGGAIKGTGLGIVYSTGGTTGGVDIVAKFLRRRYPYINFGTIMLGLDVVVIIAFTVIFNKFEAAMYGMISMYVVSKMIDLVLYGAINTKACYVITDSYDEVSHAITERLERGVTLLSGEGGWSHEEKRVILCVIKTAQIVDLRKIIREIDEDSFVIVTDAREVFGKGFSSIDSE